MSEQFEPVKHTFLEAYVFAVLEAAALAEELDWHGRWSDDGGPADYE